MPDIPNKNRVGTRRFPFYSDRECMGLGRTLGKILLDSGCSSAMS